jgi:hypothetical protein
MGRNRFAAIAAVALLVAAVPPASASESRPSTPNGTSAPPLTVREQTPDSVTLVPSFYVLSLQADHAMAVQLALLDSVPRTRVSVHAAAFRDSSRATSRALVQLARPPANGYMVSSGVLASLQLVPYGNTLLKRVPAHERQRAGENAASRQPLRSYAVARIRYPS